MGGNGTDAAASGVWPLAARSVTVRPAVAYGLVAGLGTYVTVVILLAIQVFAQAPDTVGGVGTRSFVFGTLGDFYGTHLGTTDGVALGVAGVDAVPAFVYSLVAPLVLCYCGRQSATFAPGPDRVTDGAESASRAERHERVVRQAVVQGAGVTLGYFAVVVAGLAILGGAVGFALVGVGPVRATVVAGVVYPVVFGGLGGYTTTL